MWANIKTIRTQGQIQVFINPGGPVVLRRLAGVLEVSRSSQIDQHWSTKDSSCVWEASEEKKRHGLTKEEYVGRAAGARCRLQALGPPPHRVTMEDGLREGGIDHPARASMVAVLLRWMIFIPNLAKLWLSKCWEWEKWKACVLIPLPSKVNVFGSPWRPGWRPNEV